ncbi:MAG: hypothetical protein KKH12_16000 [Gammaproteobacteria bacterium]|nr:hypothetical protein [Gammaproteobacteria bacterium]
MGWVLAIGFVLLIVSAVAWTALSRLRRLEACDDAVIAAAVGDSLDMDADESATVSSESVARMEALEADLDQQAALIASITGIGDESR